MPKISEEDIAKSLKALYDQDQVVLLIQIAEKWSTQTQLGDETLILLAKGYLRLCLLDKAWRCLRDCSESSETIA